MTAVNASFARLLDYEQRAAGGDNGQEAPASQGDWAALAFRLGDEKLVCGIDQVLESLPLPPITRAPGTKPFILGLANVRGDLLTVVDLGCFLTGTRSTTTMRSRLLSASLRGRPVGLLVDEVFGQKNFMASEATDPEFEEDSVMAEWTLKQHRAGKEEWLELDLASLFETPEFLNGAES